MSDLGTTTQQTEARRPGGTTKVIACLVASLALIAIVPFVVHLGDIDDTRQALEKGHAQEVTGTFHGKLQPTRGKYSGGGWDWWLVLEGSGERVDHEPSDWVNDRELLEPHLDEPVRVWLVDGEPVKVAFEDGDESLIGAVQERYRIGVLGLIAWLVLLAAACGSMFLQRRGASRMRWTLAAFVALGGVAVITTLMGPFLAWLVFWGAVGVGALVLFVKVLDDAHKRYDPGHTRPFWLRRKVVTTLLVIIGLFAWAIICVALTDLAGVPDAIMEPLSFGVPLVVLLVWPILLLVSWWAGRRAR